MAFLVHFSLRQYKRNNGHSVPVELDVELVDVVPCAVHVHAVVVMGVPLMGIYIMNLREAAKKFFLIGPATKVRVRAWPLRKNYFF